MRKEENMFKSVQRIATNFSQYMSIKANNWKKRSSKPPKMIIHYLTNEGMQISKQKWKVVLFNSPRVATCQIWTTTNLNNNICYRGTLRKRGQFDEYYKKGWTMGWFSGSTTISQDCFKKIGVVWEKSPSIINQNLDHPRK